MAAVLLIVLLFSVVTCTVDLNVHHLMFVADHLQPNDCKKLVNALHEEDLNPEKVPDASEEEDKPCIALLLKWDRTEGYGKTFDDLALRLNQIGQVKVAERLSKVVYEAQADELNKEFNDNPFKKKLPSNSFMLDEKKKKKKKAPVEEVGSEPDFQWWEIVAMVVGGLICGVLVLIAIAILIRKPCRKSCPSFMVEWGDMVFSECGLCLRKTKKGFAGETVGRKRTLSRTEVQQMNRNLNNYLNGHLPAAVLLYDELMHIG